MILALSSLVLGANPIILLLILLVIIVCLTAAPGPTNIPANISGILWIFIIILVILLIFGLI